MAALINKTVVRRYIIDAAKRERPGWTCTRVSGEALAVTVAIGESL